MSKQTNHDILPTAKLCTLISLISLIPSRLNLMLQEGSVVLKLATWFKWEQHSNFNLLIQAKLWTWPWTCHAASLLKTLQLQRATQVLPRNRRKGPNISKTHQPLCGNYLNSNTKQYINTNNISRTFNIIELQRQEKMTSHNCKLLHGGPKPNGATQLKQRNRE